MQLVSIATTIIHKRHVLTPDVRTGMTCDVSNNAEDLAFWDIRSVKLIFYSFAGSDEPQLVSIATTIIHKRHVLTPDVRTGTTCDVSNNAEDLRFGI